MIVFYLLIHAFRGYWKDPKLIIASDVIEYYSYLPATFIYNDLTLKFKEHKDVQNRIWGHQLENGNYVIKVSMGLSLMYAPFFLAGHAVASMTGFPADGYSIPYAAGLTMSSVFFFILGLIVLRKFLLHFYSDETTAIVIALVAIATNLTMYLTMVPAFPHTYSFFLIAAFLLLTLRWHRKASFRNAILLGLTYGMITLIRPTNAIIVLVFILWNVTGYQALKERINLFLQNWKSIVLILLFTLIVWVPQMVYWKLITGHIFYYSYNDEGFFFLQPKIWSVLFSYRKGWLLYTPAMALAVIGLYHLYKTQKHMFLGIVLFLIVNVYVISSWWCWWFGGSYGHRAFIDSYSLMAIPLAALIQVNLNRSLKYKVFMYILAGFLIFHNLFQTVKYTNTAIHWDSMSKLAYYETLWKLNATSLYFDLLIPPDYESARKGLPEQTEMLMYKNQRNSVPLEAAMADRDFAELFYQPFEEGNFLHNENFSEFLDTTVRHSCSASFAIHAEREFLPGYFTNFETLNSLNLSYIAADYYFFVRDAVPKDGIGLVMSVDKGDECVLYFYDTADRYDLKMNQWNLLHFIIAFPQGMEGNDTFGCYLWNKARMSSGFIDDFRVYGIR